MGGGDEKSEKKFLNQKWSSGPKTIFFQISGIWVELFHFFRQPTYLPPSRTRNLKKIMSKKVGWKIHFWFIKLFTFFVTHPPHPEPEIWKKIMSENWGAKLVFGPQDHFWFRNFFTFFVTPPPTRTQNLKKMMSEKVGCKIRFGSWGSFLV